MAGEREIEPSHSRSVPCSSFEAQLEPANRVLPRERAPETAQPVRQTQQEDGVSRAPAAAAARPACLPLVSSIMPSSSKPRSRQKRKTAKAPQQDGKHGQKCRYRQRQELPAVMRREIEGNMCTRLWIRCDTAE